MAATMARSTGLFIAICVLHVYGSGSSQSVPDGQVYTEVKKTLVQGFPGVLTCHFLGDPVIVYWEKGHGPDDLELLLMWHNSEVSGPRYDDKSCDIDENYSLIISNVSTVDTGRIYCTVLNDRGIFINNYTDVSVADNAIETRSEEILQMGQATYGVLQCTVRIKASKVSWKKGVTSLANETLVVLENNENPAARSGFGYDEGMYNITEDYSLIIQNVQVHHEGLYVCEATDFDTEISFQNHTFVNVIAHPPEPFPTIKECMNTEQNDSQYCTLDMLDGKSEMTLTCQVMEYYPEINLFFLHGSKVVEPSEKMEWNNTGGTKTKTVKIAARASKELYTCVASDIPGSNGRSTTSVLLQHVQDKATFNSILVILLVCFAALIFLSLVAYFIWRKRRHRDRIHGSSTRDRKNQIKQAHQTSHLDFILSRMSYAVGLGNVWRFPYVCYSNGGGAFLIPYIVMLLFAGLPLFFLELMCFGQYSRPISANWRSAPLMKGVGFGMVAVSAWVAIYYNVIITYTIFYMFKSMTSSLPWIGCHHEWNTPYCSELVEECMQEGGVMTMNNTCVNVTNLSSEDMDKYNITSDGNITVSFNDPLKHLRRRPSEEYYRHGVLHDSGDMGSFGYVIWQLALCLLLAWTLEFIIIAKGVKSSGKVVYFTAIFLYIVLVILLVRGMTLPGHMEGILFFISPEWEQLKNPKVWKDAAVQIFFSLCASWGGLITLSSFNRFKNNGMRDAFIVPILNCATSIFAGFVIFSIMGYMAHELNKPVHTVVDEQFGLAFIAYPEAVARLPISPLWAFLFFFMLITLGLGSQLCVVETVVTSIADEFNLRKWKIFFLGGYCTLAFFLGLICVTQAGNYWVILMDKYAADFALLIFCMSECIGLGWIYGVKNFTNDIRSMLGDRIVDNIAFNWWKLNWHFLTPAVLSFVMLFSWISWEPPMATESYHFPTWAHALGWLLIISVIMWIPIYWMYAFVKAKGDTFMERLKAMSTPTDPWDPNRSSQSSNVALDNKHAEATDSDHEDLPSESSEDDFESSEDDFCRLSLPQDL